MLAYVDTKYIADLPGAGTRLLCGVGFHLVPQQYLQTIDDQRKLSWLQT